MFLKCLEPDEETRKEINKIEGKGFVNRILTRVFYLLGGKIAECPSLYILTCLVVTIPLISGVFFYDYSNDIEFLYTPSNGPSIAERALAEKYFPPYSNGSFDPSRLTTIGRFARIIIEAKDGGSILKSEIYKEVAQVDQIVLNVSLTYGGLSYKYADICANWKGECFENLPLGLGEFVGKIEKKQMRISYPAWFNPTTFNTVSIPHFFGGISYDTNMTITEIKALMLNYFISADNTMHEEIGQIWEQAVIKALIEKEDSWKSIKVFKLTYSSFAVESDKNVFGVIPLLGITVLMMCAFTVVTTMVSDSVRSKPWLGFVGIISANLGSFAAMGVLCFLGVKFIGMNLAVPFICLGIGVDDTFVMIAAWRQTSVKDTVKKRMAETYAEASVSITITTLTDMLSFYVGIVTPIPSVQIFSAYAGTSVLFIYICHLFFFGGAMAISGYHEAENRHSTFWWKKSTPKSLVKKGERSLFYRIFFTGGMNPEDPDNPKDKSEHFMMTFFGGPFATFISNSLVKFFVVLAFIGYLAVATYGVSGVDEGLRVERLARTDSYMYKFIEKDLQYFKQYPYRAQILVTNRLDYSDPSVQLKLTKLIDKLTSVNHVTNEFGNNLIGSYIKWANSSQELYANSKDSDVVENPFYDTGPIEEVEAIDYDISTEQKFVNLFRTQYYNPNVPLNLDINFGYDPIKNESFIQATRIILQSTNLNNSFDEKELIIELRRLVEKEKEEGLDVTLFHPWFRFIDQYIMVRSMAIQLVSVAAIIVMLIAVLFIPNIMCALWIFFSIVSIEYGVLGFMSLLGISLDLISIICLLMCIGFSVDFSAHITYAFVSSEEEEFEDRIRRALYLLGLPILQGAISTFIGVVAMFFVDSYIFQTFLIVVSLVILFATLHALFIIPVFLSFVYGGSCCKNKKKARFAKNLQASATTVSFKNGGEVDDRGTFKRRTSGGEVNRGFGFDDDESQMSQSTQSEKRVESIYGDISEKFRIGSEGDENERDSFAANIIAEAERNVEDAENNYFEIEDKNGKSV